MTKPITLAALRTARRMLQDQYEAMLASTCPHVDDKPVIRDIDASFRSLERRYRRVLKKIDEAMR